MKLMMIFAYDMNGVIATNRVPQGMSVTGVYYRLFIQNVLRPKIRLRRPDMFGSGVLILHDNARLLIAVTMRDIFDKYGWEVLLYPPYSPVLSPPDFDLFPKL
ncbi:Mariner Mos1 transposase [Blattella germanica]|nr:Mariner Mos1 transposase [Blattella germanica]